MKVCSFRGDLIQLDKYKSPSIKASERKLRRSGRNYHTFAITGPDQAHRQSVTELLKNGAFMDEFARFPMDEWKKPHYGSL